MPRPQAPPSPASTRQTATVVQGSRSKPPAAVASVLPFKASEHPAFLLGHLPECWEYYQQVDRVLPRFSIIRLVPGVGRVDAKGNPDMALVELQKGGGKLIRDQDTEDGYSRDYQMVGGTGYLPVWAIVRQTGRIAEMDTSYKVLCEFADKCIETGLIAPISELAALSLARKYEHAASLVANLAAGGNHSAKRELALYTKAGAACTKLLEEIRKDDEAVDE